MKFKRYKNESIKLDSKLKLDESVFKDYNIEDEDTEDSVDTVDMETPFDNKCEKCNALLTDAGTCPVCDDGEEDYTDLEEACADYRVRRFGAYWFGAVGPDGLMLRDETGKLRLFKTPSEAQNFIDTQCGSLTEELTNLEKLKKAFPELNFNKNSEVNVLEEGMGADTAHAVHDSMRKLAEDDTRQWAKTTADILEVVPDNFMDELFDMVKNNLSDIKLNHSNKSKIVDSLDDTVTEEGTADANTLGDILNAIDVTVWAKKNPKFIKDALIVILGIIALLEPGPVVEIITAIVMLLPENFIAKVVSMLNVFNPVTMLNKQVQKEELSVREKLKAKYPELNFDSNALTEELSNKEKLKAAYPELNFDSDTNEDLSEELTAKEKLKAAFPELNFDKDVVTENIDSDDLDEDPYRDYDDDYDDLDDVEQDRIHAALYGGDRMYCNCGTKLKMNEWGGYCPKCEPEMEFDSDVEE